MSEFNEKKYDDSAQGEAHVVEPVVSDDSYEGIGAPKNQLKRHLKSRHIVSW